MSAVVLNNRQLGTRKTHLGPCLLLLKQRANNMLTHSHEVLPVLCCSSCADVISPILALAMTHTQVHVDMPYIHVNTHKHKLNTFNIPRCFIYFLLAELPRAGKSQRKQSCCCLCRLGASFPDRGPSRDIPERRCQNGGGGLGVLDHFQWLTILSGLSLVCIH